MSGLARKTLLLTRAAEDAEVWAQAIEDRGGRALHLPCIVCEPVDDPAATAEALRSALEGADWLALTSRRGAAAVAFLLEGKLASGVRVAAVGPTTASICTRTLGRCDLVADGGTGLALARALKKEYAGHPPEAEACVVAAAADRARLHLERLLEPAGVRVVRIPVYRTRPVGTRDPRRDLSTMGIDAILLASPSAAQGLTNQATVPAGLPVLSIGPSTTEAARGLGLCVTAEAPHPDLEGLLEVVP